MGLALKVSEHVTDVPSDEARARIELARLQDIIFLIRRIARVELTDDDTRMLATVLLESEQKNISLTKQNVEAALLEKGRAPQKAHQLSSAIFK